MGRVIPVEAGGRSSPKAAGGKEPLEIVEGAVGGRVPLEVGVQAFWSMVGSADKESSLLNGPDCTMEAAAQY